MRSFKMIKQQGQCHCGKNTFFITGSPEFQFVCYCNSCRLLNGSGHLCGILFDSSVFLPSESTQTYTYSGGSGNEITLHFCPTCATHLYAYPSEYQGKVVIRANTLNDAKFKPQQSIFTESAFDWDPVFPN